MTIETFTNVLLLPIGAADDTVLTGIPIQYFSHYVEDMYRLFNYYSDSYVTTVQKNCFEMYYNKNLSQRKICEYLKLTQPTVSEHIAKARLKYLNLVKIIYYSYLEGVNFEREQKAGVQ